jgi:hypothetical protein
MMPGDIHKMLAASGGIWNEEYQDVAGSRSATCKIFMNSWVDNMGTGIM